MKIYTAEDIFTLYFRVPDNCDVSLHGNPETVSHLEWIVDGLRTDLARKGSGIGVSYEWNSAYKSYALKLTNIPPDEYFSKLLIFTGTMFRYDFTIQ